MGEIRSSLKVDLSELKAQLQSLDQRQTAQERRTARVLEQIRVADRSVKATEKLVNRLQDKMKDLSKDFVKAGLASAASSALDQLQIESTEGKFLTGVISNTLTGAAFGGAPGAAFAAMASTLTGLINAWKEIKATQQRLAVEAAQLRTQIEINNLRAIYAEEQAEKRFREELEEMREQMSREAEDLMYESSQYVDGGE
jgi:chromosome segregation ATPase